MLMATCFTFMLAAALDEIGLGTAAAWTNGFTGCLMPAYMAKGLIGLFLTHLEDGFEA